MFTSEQNGNSDSGWKNKQDQFMRDSARQDRQNILQSHRYFNFSQIIDWRVPFHIFREKVLSTYNYYTLITTLFEISDQMNWREYIEHMSILISTFHNIMSSKKGSNIHDLKRIEGFQQRFQKLFLLKDLTLHKHLILLLKMLLAYNPKYLFMKQTKFSEILVQSATYNDIDTLSEILWTLAQIQVSTLALVKLCKLQKNVGQAIEKSQNCLLPFLTILANFLAIYNGQTGYVEHLVNQKMFQKAWILGTSSSCLEIINETILLFNNGLCFDPSIRDVFLKEDKILTLIFTVNCKQTEKFFQIANAIGLNCENLKQRTLQTQTKMQTWNRSSETCME